MTWIEDRFLLLSFHSRRVKVCYNIGYNISYNVGYNIGYNVGYNIGYKISIAAIIAVAGNIWWECFIFAGNILYLPEIFYICREYLYLVRIS